VGYYSGASDQEIYDSGLSRSGYARALAAENRARTLESARQANTVHGQERNGSRFMDAGGVPTSKVRWKQEDDLQRENTARELFQKIQLHKAAGIPVNFDVAAFGNTLGFQTPAEVVAYLRSPACASRFK
jgi:hypothetical protein